jgi:choline kinase
MNAPFPPPPPQANDTELLGPLPARRVVRKAVILAAGRGRRMGKLTKDRPKAALVVGDHALIDWQIAALQAAGVEDIAVVTGHGAQALAGRGVTYIHNPDWTQGTQVGSLLCARDWIGDEPVIVSYGDIIYHPSAALALLERPGDIVIAYDADHRWLWKRRFGNWLKDSETFRLGPGQTLAEVGGRPTDIEVIDGQFMGLMLFTSAGLETLAQRFRAADETVQHRLDFTKLLAALIAEGERVDTAANLLPWIEVDGPTDLRLARTMAKPEGEAQAAPRLVYSAHLANPNASEAEPPPQRRRQEPSKGSGSAQYSPRDFDEIRRHRVANAFAVQNWGRSGSTLVQSLLDDHPQVLSTPNFYSRRYYSVWSRKLAGLPDTDKIEAFLEEFRQWWDPGLVDATAGLHRLGLSRRELAGVRRADLEGYLRAALPSDRQITRRTLFEAAHLAYALARDQDLAPQGLQICFAVHGEPRAVAAAFLEDFPQARFVHTVRQPHTNVASTIQYYCFNQLDLRSDPVETTLQALFERKGRRDGQVFTLFSDRPYFEHLVGEDRTRLLRLEDLHQDARSVMASAAAWLGLADNDRLAISSFDGKTWWNRPESGPTNRLDGAGLTRNVGERLSTKDHRKIDLILGHAPQVREAYGVARTQAGVWRRWLAVLSPWRQETRARRTELRCLGALLKASRILPRAMVARLIEAHARERHRARLLGLSSGAIGVRKTLADNDKPGAITAVLFTSPSEQGWKTRALASTRIDRLEQPDRLTVAFLDEALSERSPGALAFWLLVLGLGWPLARLQTGLRIRRAMARLILGSAVVRAGASMALIHPLPSSERTSRPQRPP